jgi:PPIC-type PPIASE domain
MRLPYELLVHVVALGPLLYAGYWLAADHGAPRERIVIDGSQVASIRAQFRGTWRRNPTDEEMRGLIESAVREEVLIREGEALGLARSDPAAIERVRRKYEALADQWLAAHAPTEETLADWLELHAADYARPGTVSYSQLLLVAAGTAGDPEAAARKARYRLDRGVKRARVGLPTPLPAREFGVGLDDIARDYGPHFADAVAQLPVGIWLGPIESRFGAHLVRVDSRMPGAPPLLYEVRQEVLRDFDMKRRQHALEASLAAMRRKYEIVVEPTLARQASR